MAAYHSLPFPIGRGSVANPDTKTPTLESGGSRNYSSATRLNYCGRSVITTDFDKTWSPHALNVAHRVKEKRPDRRVMFLTAERFDAREARRLGYGPFIEEQLKGAAPEVVARVRQDVLEHEETVYPVFDTRNTPAWLKNAVPRGKMPVWAQPANLPPASQPGDLIGAGPDWPENQPGRN